MDKWSEEQVKRMQLGGNKKAVDFFRLFPGWWLLIDIGGRTKTSTDLNLPINRLSRRHEYTGMSYRNGRLMLHLARPSYF